MAVITREELISAVTSRLGELPDDDGVVLLENLSDTLDSYEARANIDFEGERARWEEERTNYEQRIRDVDSDWRRRYTERFNQPVESHVSVESTQENISDNSDYVEEITYDDLFEVKEK